MKGKNVKRSIGVVIALALFQLSCAPPSLTINSEEAGLVEKWDACEEKVLRELSERGRREWGDPSAYTGVNNAGAYEEIASKCGYKPLTANRCNDLYIEVYLSCRSRYRGEEYPLSGLEWQWLRGYDPDTLDPDRIQSLCVMKDRVSRKEFGDMLCGGK